MAEIHALTNNLQGKGQTAQPTPPTTETQATAAATEPASTPASASAPKPPPTAEQIDAWKAELNTKKAELNKVQGESPLVHPCVDRQAIAETVASWTGIPVGRMVSDEIQTVLNLHELMERQIVGQSHALQRIAKSIRTSRAQLNDPRAPIACSCWPVLAV